MGNLGDIVRVLHSLGTWPEWGRLPSAGAPGAMSHMLAGEGGGGTHVFPLCARPRAEECQVSVPELSHSQC